jgi:hypothetical protein
MLMNKKQEIKEVLAESLSKSFLLPIKETLGKNKIPKTIWEDSFLVGFLLTHFSEYMHLLELETLVKLEPEEVSEVIKNSDPDNAELILNYFTGDIEPNFDEEEFKRGEEIAKRFLFLGFKHKFFVIPFEYDESDGYLSFAYSKASNIKEMLSAAYPGSYVIENMTRDEAASQALAYYKVFEYVKENKNKFLNVDSSVDEKITIRDIYKYSKSNLGKGVKSGVNKVLDADLRQVGKKTEEIVQSAGEGLSDGLSALVISIFKGLLVIGGIIIILLLLGLFAG